MSPTSRRPVGPRLDDRVDARLQPRRRRARGGPGASSRPPAAWGTAARLGGRRPGRLDGRDRTARRRRCASGPCLGKSGGNEASASPASFSVKPSTSSRSRAFWVVIDTGTILCRASSGGAWRCPGARQVGRRSPVGDSTFDASHDDRNKLGRTPREVKAIGLSTTGLLLEGAASALPISHTTVNALSPHGARRT